MTKEVGDQRRHRREASSAKVSLGWTDASGVARMVQGKSLDTSVSGLRVQLIEEIPVGANVFVRAQSLQLNGPALVRYCRRKGLNFIVGLELANIRKAE